MTEDQLLVLAEAANQAPSVHNTQPTRWRLADDGAIVLFADPSRRLIIGDPHGRDLAVSVGAALEGTAIALAERGLGIGRLDLLDGADPSGLLPMARLELTAARLPDPLALAISIRQTWRRGFAPVAGDRTRAIGVWASGEPDLTMVTDLGAISRLNEAASLAFYRRPDYRAELLSWMRLAPSNPRFGVDGLSAPALGMSPFEAFGAGLALRQPLFGLLDGVGLFAGLVSEHQRTMGATAVLLFHRPADEHPVLTGRALYRRLLSLADQGFQAWPMSVLADYPATAAELARTYAIPDHRRLITAWRIGAVPPGASTSRERLPTSDLVV